MILCSCADALIERMRLLIKTATARAGKRVIRTAWLVVECKGNERRRKHPFSMIGKASTLIYIAEDETSSSGGGKKSKCC